MFFKPRLTNHGPEVFSNLFRSILGAHFSSEWPDLSKAFGEAELSLTLLSLPSIAHVLRTGILCHVWLTGHEKAVMGKQVCVWMIYLEPLYSIWKLPNTKRHCQIPLTNAMTNKIFLPSENVMDSSSTCHLCHCQSIMPSLMTMSGSFPLVTPGSFGPFKKRSHHLQLFISPINDKFC